MRSWHFQAEHFLSNLSFDCQFLLLFRLTIREDSATEKLKFKLGNVGWWMVLFSRDNTKLTLVK